MIGEFIIGSAVVAFVASLITARGITKRDHDLKMEYLRQEDAERKLIEKERVEALPPVPPSIYEIRRQNFEYQRNLLESNLDHYKHLVDGTDNVSLIQNYHKLIQQTTEKIDELIQRYNEAQKSG